MDKFSAMHFPKTFSYNVRSDSLKQRALSENRLRVDNIKLVFKFLVQNFEKFDPN